MRGLALILIGAICAVAAGCGAERGSAPDLPTTAAAPDKTKLYVQDGKDVTFLYPSNWVLQERRPPGVVTVSSGGAEVTIWAYRTPVTVLTPADADVAMKRYLVSLKMRDPAFAVEKAKTVAATAAFGFEVIGTTQISGRDVKARSVHVYRGRGEYVTDAISDPDQFNKVNSEVFQPLLESTIFFGFPRVIDPVQEGAGTAESSGRTG